MLSMDKNKEDMIGKIGDIVWMNLHYNTSEPDIKQYGFINDTYMVNNMKDDIILFFVTLFNEPQNQYSINFYYNRGLYWDYADDE